MPTTLGGLTSELAYLRVLYELTDGKATQAVFYGDIDRELDWTPERTDEVAYFWADRGVLEWTAFGQVALTPMGLRRAQRLAAKGWSVTAL